MHATNQVVAVDEAVGHQCAPVRAAAIENRYAIVEAHDHEVDAGDQRVSGSPVLEFIPGGDIDLVHLGSLHQLARQIYDDRGYRT